MSGGIRANRLPDALRTSTADRRRTILDVLRRARTLRIPMAPGFDSLNVAVASGIALQHASRLTSA